MNMLRGILFSPVPDPGAGFIYHPLDIVKQIFQIYQKLMTHRVAVVRIFFFETRDRKSRLLRLLCFLTRSQSLTELVPT